MQIGTFTIEQLSEGFFELFEDGTFQKMDPSRVKLAADDPTLGKFSSALGIDPLLVDTGTKKIVIDPGLGWGLDHNSRFKDTSNVVTNLNIFGHKPEDIDHVILSHLHFDHAAGCTFVNSDFKTEATFPNALYHVHTLEWEYAIESVDRRKNTPGADYRMDELWKLAAEKRLRFIDREIHDLLPGVTLMKTGGHSPGHTVVKLESDGKFAWYMGDLVPTEYHLNHYSMRQIDLDPIQSKKAKTIILRQALKENALMFFYHSLYKKSGKLSLDEKRRYVLLDV
jgi:glyoxylase-like metal-dependent hydrolase (beta-lactamase superfamily II)